MRIKRFLCVTVALLMLFVCFAGCEERRPVRAKEEEESQGFAPTEPTEPTAEEREPADLSFEAITEGLSLPVTEEFILTHPEGDFETVAESYYITGVSDPDKTLRMNGITIESRGEFGSFGEFVPLEFGENRFRFEHGEEEHILVITRPEFEDYTLADSITSPEPSFDRAVRAGSVLTLSCVAPSGATVTATLGETTLDMAQDSATDVEGIPVRFTAAFDPGETEGMAELGPATYVMNWQGETKSASSAGSVFAVGAEDDLLVSVSETAVTTFNEESDASGFHNTLKRGVLDRVEEIGASMYRLASGGWVFQHSVQPALTDKPYESEVGGISFEQDGRLETITFHGTATPPYASTVADGILSLTLYHTTLSAELDLGDSEIVTAAESLDGENGVTVNLTLDTDKYWGHLVQYDGEDTVLTLRSRPEPELDDWPLEGVTVLLDPGHGGTDNGAAGVAQFEGAVEKEINLAAATATKRYLEALGATVLMTREGDEKTELDAILAENEAEKPDFFLSLHSNSISPAQDGTEPSGVEIFFYEDGDAPLAETLVNAVTERTNRVNRGAKQDYYRVTLCSLSRSLLVEMGFLTNPVEYDSLRSMEQIYNTATAIGDGLVKYLSGEPWPVVEEDSMEEDGAEDITEEEPKEDA